MDTLFRQPPASSSLAFALRGALFCVALACLASLSACGQRGPLYLPDDAPVKKTTPNTTPNK